MAFLSAVIGVRDSSGVRVDSPDSLGNYLPIVLKLGSDLTSSVTQSGGVSVVTINATGSVTSVTGTAPITSSGGATPAIGISAASGGAAGSMSAAHYTLVNNATDAATASTLVKRDGSSVTKLAALELGATPSTTLGQLRATAGNVLSAKIGPAGEDRTILSTDNEHFLLGSTYGNVVAQIANGVTKFRVLDPFVLGPTAVAAEFGSAQIDLYNLVKLYGGTATTATAKGHVGLDSTGRLTVYADGAEQIVPVMGDVGGTSWRTTPDAHDLGVWRMDESSSSFANSGADGTLALTATGNVTYLDEGSLGTGVYLDTAVTSYVASADTTKCQPTSISVWSWVRVRSPNAWYPLVVAKLHDLTGAGFNPPYFDYVIEIYPTGNNGKWLVGANVSGTLQTIDCGSANRFSIVTDRPHLLAMTYDGTTLKAYMDGLLAGSLVAAGAISYGDGRIVRGGSPSSASYGIDGWLGEFRVRDQVMAASEFAEIYRRGMGVWP